MAKTGWRSLPSWYSRLLIPGIGLLVVGACAPVTQNISIDRPAQFPQAAAVRRVAVMPFGGPQGSEIAAQFEAKLAAVRVENKPYFTVLGGQQASRSMGQAGSRQISGVDVASAQRVGASLGADGIYGGDVTGFATEVTPFQQRRIRCVQSSGSGFIKKCTQTSEYSVSCQSLKAIVTVSPRLIEVSTGRILYSTQRSAAREASGCSDDGAPLPSRDTLLSAALTSVIEQMRRDVAPYTEITAVVMKQSPAALTGKEVEQFRSGVEFMNAGQADRACAIWTSLEQSGADDTNLSFNLAICDERKGDLSAALERLKGAEAKLDRPDRSYIEATERIQVRLDQQGEYTRQLAQADAASTSRSLAATSGKGPTSSMVREAQNLLRKLGIYAGATDGIAGPRTQAAVRKFQGDTGLPVDGIVTPDLLTQLRAQASGAGRPAGT